MEDLFLLQFISAYGTQKSIPLKKILVQVGDQTDIYHQLERMTKEGKIEIIGDDVFLKRADSLALDSDHIISAP